MINELAKRPFSSVYLIPNLCTSFVEVTPDELIEMVCSITHVGIRMLYSGNRQKEVSYSRWLVWHVLHSHNHSLVYLGRLFGKHHTTVLHAMKNIDAELEINPWLTECKRKLSNYYKNQ